MTSIISRFYMKCLAVSIRNHTSHSIVSPITAYNHSKRYQSSSNGDVSRPVDTSLNDDFDYESEFPYSNIDFEAISEGDADKLKALKILQLKIELKRQQGERVPSQMAPCRWKDLLTLQTPVAQDRYLHHLWVVEMKQKHRKEKSEKKAQLFAQFKAQQEEVDSEPKTTCSPLDYKLNETALFHRIRDCTMNQFYNYRLLLAEWFGPKILVDCSYEQFMPLKSLQSCVKQMLIMWSDNRDTTNPFDIIYCNVDPQSSLWNKFTQRIPMLNAADSPVHYTDQHYLDLFPREKLVYLTPHCEQILEHYNHDDIYIIGAYVDASRSQPLSLAKAKKEKLRMAKLPLDKYLLWAVGTKSLPINQVLGILNDLKDGSSWPVALKHVPSRKITSHNSKLEGRERKVTRQTAKSIRQNFHANLVYDLLMNDGWAGGSKKS